MRASLCVEVELLRVVLVKRFLCARVFLVVVRYVCSRASRCKTALVNVLCVHVDRC